MRKELQIAIVLLTVTVLILQTSLVVEPAPVGIPILIDLTHAQPSSGIDIIMRMVPEAQWYILVKTEEDKEALSPMIKSLAHGIIVGDFTTVDLGKYRIEMIIIGQPQALFTPDEVAAIVAWFTKYPNRAIWVAADSDYPAQGSETAQQAVNMILEALGASLRLDYVSIEDHESNALKPYRVLAFIKPDPEVSVLGYACERVLFHGPGGISWVDEAGTWHKLTRENKPKNAYVVAITSSKGLVAEHQAEPKGITGKAYTPGEEGVFTVMAVELIEVKKGYGRVIVSGESPYGGYQPLTTWMYYGFRISGPQFVRNVILWATGYMGELRAVETIMSAVDEKLATMRGELEKVKREVSATVGGISSVAYLGTGIGVIALIVGILALIMATRKPK